MLTKIGPGCLVPGVWSRLLFLPCNKEAQKEDSIKFGENQICRNAELSLFYLSSTMKVSVDSYELLKNARIFVGLVPPQIIVLSFHGVKLKRLIKWGFRAVLVAGPHFSVECKHSECQQR